MKPSGQKRAKLVPEAGVGSPSSSSSSTATTSPPLSITQLYQKHHQAKAIDGQAKQLQIPPASTAAIAHRPHLFHLHELGVDNLVKRFLANTNTIGYTNIVYLVGLLEYVDKLRGVLAVLLGEEGVGGACVTLPPCSANPADY